MSQQPGATPPREDHETTLFAGVPGPSGTGTQTDACADPDGSVDQGAAMGQDAR